ncbi:MAG: hypothetical protein ACRDMV_17725 [Streptosporangiales bacterium]
MTDMIHWNVGGMQGLKDAQDGAHGRFNGILADIQSCRSQMMGQWQGEGTAPFLAKETRHENNYSDLQNAFRRLIGATDTSIGNVQGCFSKVNGIWG